MEGDTRRRIAVLLGLLTVVIVAAGCGGDGDTGPSSTAASEGPPSTGAARPGEAVRLVRGAIPADGDATIGAVFAIEDAGMTAPEPGPFRLEFLDVGGAVLSGVTFDVLEPVAEGGATPDAIFVVPVPEPGPDAVELRLLRESDELLVVAASDTEPTVAVVEPADGATLAGDEVLISWQATDGDDDELSYLASFRLAGEDWQTIGIGDRPEAVLVPGDYPTGAEGTVRVTVSDGFHSTSVDVSVVIG